MRTRRLFITPEDLARPPAQPTTPIGILQEYGLRNPPGPVSHVKIIRGGRDKKIVELSGWSLNPKDLERAIKRMEECGYKVVNKAG